MKHLGLESRLWLRLALKPEMAYMHGTQKSAASYTGGVRLIPISHMSELLNSRTGKQKKVEHRIQKGCTAMGKPERQHPAIHKLLQCTFSVADASICNF